MRIAPNIHPITRRVILYTVRISLYGLTSFYIADFAVRAIAGYFCADFFRFLTLTDGTLLLSLNTYLKACDILTSVGSIGFELMPQKPLNFLIGATFIACTASVNFCMRLYFNHCQFVTLAQELCILALTYFSIKEELQAFLAGQAADAMVTTRIDPNEVDKYLPFFNTEISIRALAAVTLLLPCIHMFCGLKQN